MDPSRFAGAIVHAADRANIGVGVVTIEESGARAVYVNEAACAIMGRAPEEMLGGNLLEFVAPEEHESFRELIARRLRGEGAELRSQTVIIRADGTRVPVSYTTAFLTLEGRATSVFFITDLSEWTRARAELEASEQRFRTLAEFAPDGIVISRDARVLYANRAAARILGHADPASMVDLPMSTFLDARGMRTMRDRLNAKANGASLAPFTYVATRADGTRILAEITSVPVHYDGGPAVIAIARDVTDRVKLQEQLAHADRLAAIGTLAAGVAHEVNNPLAYVSLGLQALERHLERWIPNEAERQRALQLVRDVSSGASRVARIVRDLKTFTRKDDEEIGPVDLRHVIAAAERIVGRELRQRAEVVMEIDEVPLVRGAAARLEQVLVNLLLNAAQAIEDDRKGLVQVRAGAKDGWVFVEVIDDGRGIPAPNLARVFDPFFTTKPIGVGTGLGLFVCAGIVRDLGGDIVAESEGKGARFRVLLRPFEGRAPVRAEPPSSPTPPTSGRRARVLVIDDEPAVGAMLHRLLQATHDVTVVPSGEAALEALEHASFDVLLCDLLMPGMTGMDLYDRVAAERPGTERSFIFMTGGAFTPRARSFLERVPNARLDKPFTLERLEALIRERVP